MMIYARALLMMSLLGLLSLNGCMLGHMGHGDESDMHGSMSMPMSDMMHSNDDEETSQ